ncbi:MAG: type IX secretion system sortase PorU [Bacteroidota bacterium]
MKKTFLFLISFAIYANIFSQSITKNVILKWQPVEKLLINENQSFSRVSFLNCTYKNDVIPVYSSIENVADNITKVTISISNPIFQDLNDAEINTLKSIDVSKDIDAKAFVLIDRKKKFVQYNFNSIIKNLSTGALQKLISCTLNIQLSSEKDFAYQKVLKTADNSVLATGSWYKMALTYEGVYKVTYSDLQSLGIDPSTIDPRNLRIYNNGGGMLAEKNSDFRHDDLAENSIYVYGESDGVFNAGDYILFYGQSPHRVVYNESTGKFIHNTNIYSDVNYYFLNTDLGIGKRIVDNSSSSQVPNYSTTTFNDYRYWDVDSLNLIKSGREWMGKYYDQLSTYNFSFNFPDINTSSDVDIDIRVASRSTLNASFNFNANGNTSTLSVGAINPSYNSEFAKTAIENIKFKPLSSSINLSTKFNKASGAQTSVAWLDYISINARRNLILSSEQFLFRDVLSVGATNISEFKITNTNSNLVLWDITNSVDVKNQLYNFNSGMISFVLPTDTLREFMLFNPSAAYSPTFEGAVANQNLHSVKNVDMIIITHPDFYSEANTLADFHRTHDSLTVYVVTPQLIYNEFSSGKQDAGAIRDFMKMLYTKVTTPKEMPDYLLLFGDGSFDNKNRIAENTNFIPTYQNQNSVVPTSSFVSDDFYVLLDSNEGVECVGLLDMGIGRFPVATKQEAAEAVEKVIRYSTKCDNTISTGCSANNSISNFSDWKNTVCLIADDEDNGLHFTQADEMAETLTANYKQYNLNKIYFDAYQQLSTPGGERFPEVTDAINRQVDKGALIINYTGHGGEVGWAHERVIGVSDINKWSNYCNLPIFMTATCEFSRWDDPERVSAGEYVFLNKNGGGISLFTTTRLVFASSNFSLNKEFYRHVFDKIDGKLPRMGDVIRLSKNGAATYPNDRNFSLLGDPALLLAFPNYKVVTNTINNKPISTTNDTIKALSKVTVTGAITNDAGIVMTNFNGIIYPTVFDKETQVSTLGNDPTSPISNFNIQKNILYKGKASVINGYFTFTFIAPKDIAYKYGAGKISYYATDANVDANGYFDNVIIGGSNSSALSDNIGPEIKLFLNSEKFAFGGLTNESPILIAYVSDSNGVNTIGSGIGHDITAVLDDNTNNTIILNEYYEADVDNFQKGTIRYGLKDLTEGKHTLKIKVWDTYNNSSETYTEFVVAKSENFSIDHVLNYPNPFTTRTEFYFEHNQPCCDLGVLIQIYTINGKLVKTIEQQVNTIGYRAEPIEWDGLDDFGNKLGKGVYFYKLKVRSKDGNFDEKIQKLVIL